eukprot:gnl/TRDRNA2_/TRDRNA2_29752_c0_seq1.p1 gnl/TRDRNA2_/TRDRNA2_29752_c0~~gnl/TRDRNA2_/TRDRNA2_29752_c0_seq1.p1  ORF type:complete len:243 (-),score=58.14 gnl/TRDRNA2_/TRDRNA2_29752_c0_seq1:91-819(-)
MGQTVSSIQGRMFGPKTSLRILMLGLDAAGKTTILYKLRLGEVETTIPTIGFNVEHLEHKSAYKITSFTAWDVGGRDKIRGLWRFYYRETDALVFVVDSNDRGRIEETKDQLYDLLNEEELRDVPLLVFANKQDLPGSMTADEIVNKLSLHAIRGRLWHIQASCATTGDGLYDGLEWLSDAKKRQQEDQARRQMRNKTHEAAGEKTDVLAKQVVAGGKPVPSWPPQGQSRLQGAVPGAAKAA